MCERWIILRFMDTDEGWLKILQSYKPLISVGEPSA